MLKIKIILQILNHKVQDNELFRSFHVVFDGTEKYGQNVKDATITTSANAVRFSS